MTAAEVHATEREIKALEELAVKVKKKQAGYKLFVVIFAVIGVLTALLGYVCITGGSIAIGIFELVLAAAEIYMAVDGILMTARQSFRKAALTINQKKSDPKFSKEKVQVSCLDGKTMDYRWSEFDAFTNAGSCIWIISDKKFKQLAIYINKDTLTPEQFAALPQALAMQGVKEVKTGK